MKTIITFAAALAAFAVFASNSYAQGTATNTQHQNGTHQGHQQNNDAASASGTYASKLDDKVSGSQVRVSQLMGMNIQNAKGENVGEISDVVVDTNTGKISYAAVTYGGIMGIGNKMHAVPFKAFKTKQDPDDKDETCLVLNVTQEQMEGETGFDEDNWPNSADQTFTSNMNKRYSVDDHSSSKDHSGHSSTKKNSYNK